MNKEEKPIAERINNCLRRCLPITTEDEQLTCETCPYYQQCESSGYDVTSVRLPMAMISDLRRLVSGVLQ